MDNVKIEFEKVIEFLKKELGKLRVGRATPSLVEDIKIDYYGTPTPLKQLATINTPESDLIVISPWDRTVLGVIEKTIASSSLGINPIVDQDIIRLKMPPLTEERRRDIVKLLHKEIEEAKIAIRNAREALREDIKKMVDNEEIAEDERFKKFEEIDKIVKEYNNKIEEIGEGKEKEIMSI